MAEDKSIKIKLRSLIRWAIKIWRYKRKHEINHGKDVSDGSVQEAGGSPAGNN
jgi:hypothetical protein